MDSLSLSLLCALNTLRPSDATFDMFIREHNTSFYLFYRIGAKLDNELSIDQWSFMDLYKMTQAEYDEHVANIIPTTSSLYCVLVNGTNVNFIRNTNGVVKLNEEALKGTNNKFIYSPNPPSLTLATLPLINKLMDTANAYIKNVHSNIQCTGLLTKKPAVVAAPPQHGGASGASFHSIRDITDELEKLDDGYDEGFIIKFVNKFKTHKSKFSEIDNDETDTDMPLSLDTAGGAMTEKI